jgi:thioester reductase-like protein
MPNIFFTGFPGFLGSELLPRVLGRAPDNVAICLVQAKFAQLAWQRAAALASADPSLADRIRLVEGDITMPGLGLPDEVRDVTEVYHLAAAYDLALTRAAGMRINVGGTRNVLDFAARSPSLRRVHYVSTCYVSGRYHGTFRESDLEKGQRFNNHYEETKYLAEVEVQQRMAKGLPATIYRPAVVVGDSTTGATQKFDGPYFVIQWILRQPKVAVLPMVGRPSKHTFNVVPRDFVVEAMAALSGRSESVGKVYQLADPEPLTISKTVDAIAEATEHTILRVPMTRGMAKGALHYVPGVYRLMRIPPGAVDYFVHPTSYDTTNVQRDLGIAAPHLRDYLPQLIAFVRQHPEIGAAAMV